MSSVSKLAQLQRLLGKDGTVEPYVHVRDAEHPAPGWYAKLNNGHKPPPDVWAVKPKVIYLGVDTPYAAVTISKVTSPQKVPAGAR